MVDNKISVGGQTAVMAINEKLLQRLRELNPEAKFGMQESFPMKSFYEDAIPLGPILEIKSTVAEDSSFTPEMATEFLQRWQDKSALLLNDPEALNSSETLKNYSHDVVSSGNLLAAREYTNEAEEAYRLSGKSMAGKSGSRRGPRKTFGRHRPES